MHKYNYQAICGIHNRLGLPLKEMAKAINIDPGRMGHIELGIVNPTIEEFVKLWDLANEQEKNDLICDT